MRKRLLRGIVLLAALAMVAAACGGDDDTAAEDGDEPASGPANVIRFTFAPDPVWDYLNDSGIKEEMESETEVRIIAQTTWDEFGIYAGGHADVISVGSFEVPVLEEESGQPAVVFGKYNIDRSVVAVRAEDTTSQTLADLTGKRIAVWDTVSSTLIWGVIAELLHDVDFRTGGGDFELVVVDITNTASVLAAGDVDACLCLPDFGVPEFSSGELRVLYDGRSSAEVYAQDVANNEGHEGPMINIFMAREDWYDEHPEEIAFFLELWERGLQEWAANKDQIIADYPQHFAVETDEQIAWMSDYLTEHDWFASSVYIDDDWVETESGLFDQMREAGFMEAENPRFETPAP